MTRGDVPEWAKKRACELANVHHDRALDYRVSDVGRGGHGAITALALYISEHEEEPVDPLLEEVQTLADAFNRNLSAMPWLEAVLLAAIKRGMELAKEPQP